MWILPSAVASLAAVGLEYIYRTRMFGSYLAGWWLIIPLGITIQVALFYSFRDAPKLLSAWVVFFALNLVLRVVLSGTVLHEGITPTMGVAVALVICGALVMRL